MSDHPTIELLYFDGCPSHERLLPPVERTDFGLKCRIYRSDEGASPLPPGAWIRAALE